MIAEMQPVLPSVEKQLPGKANLANKKTDVDFKQITKEYALKRNNFNPDNTSPNFFINKLKKRYNYYYVKC
jgi:hypothetical protein